MELIGLGAARGKFVLSNLGIENLDARALYGDHSAMFSDDLPNCARGARIAIPPSLL